MRIHNYFSSVTKSARQFHVYTPPGYDRAHRGPYPVLVLLPGSWDHDGAWIQVGRAGIVIDNLLAGKKATPMLLVMPDGHPYPSFDVATRTRNLEVLRRDLLEEVFSMVEKSYRVEKRPHGRAIAGFSMGGVQALHLGLSTGHFGSVGASSAPGYIPSGPTLEDVLRQAQRLPQALDLLWLACGRQDALFAEARQVHSSLLKAGVRHVWRDVDGDHTWMVWRRNLAEFVQLLFVSH